MTITSKNLTFQHLDNLNEDNLRKFVRLLTTSPDGKIGRGLTVTADHVNNNISVDSGVAIIVDDTGDGAYLAEHPGLTDASVANTSGMNYVFVSINPADTSANDVSVDIESTNSPPRTPALKIAEVDTLNDQPAQMFNDNDGTFADIEATNSITDASGTQHTGELADVADLNSYLPLDGTSAMTGNLQLGTNLVSYSGIAGDNIMDIVGSSGSGATIRHDDVTLRVWGYDTSAGSGNSLLEFDPINQTVNAVASTLQQAGNAVATETWVQNTATANDANTVDGYEVQKNGTDGTGIINFKT